MLVSLVAMFAVVLGMTGLAADHALVAYDKRILQNAVDAGATTGAIDLVQGSVNRKVQNTYGDVTTVVARNVRQDMTAAQVPSCSFIDDTRNVTNSGCTQAVDTTSGVRVAAGNPRQTFFMQVFGIPSVDVTAASSARVWAWNSYNSDASLFIVCGYSTIRTSNGLPTPIIDHGAGSRADGPWTVLQSAIGVEFNIHDPNPADLEDCNAQGSRMKGVQRAGQGLKAPGEWILSENGTRAGPTTAAVEGIDGCRTGLNENIANNCVMMLPVVAVSSRNGSQDSFKIAHWLPFRIRRTAANAHTGTLLGPNYVLRANEQIVLLPWSVGSTSKPGPVSVRTEE